MLLTSFFAEQIPYGMKKSKEYDLHAQWSRERFFKSRLSLFQFRLILLTYIVIVT